MIFWATAELVGEDEKHLLLVIIITSTQQSTFVSLGSGSENCDDIKLQRTINLETVA